MDVFKMSVTERVAEALRRSKGKMGPEAGAMVDALLSPTNLAIMVATLVVWAGSHFFGVGEIVDVLLLVVGAFAIGWSIGDVAKDLFTFANLTINAQSDADLDRAAAAFAHAVILAGITVIMAILLRRSVKSIQAARGPNVMQAMRPRSPGLPKVSADPDAGKLWSRPGIVNDPALSAGRGSTSAFGRVRLSPLGSTTEQALVRAHELVHRFLTPRFGLLRTFRVRLRMSGYLRSALLRYIEEALAETIAQLRVNGFAGTIEGIKFPVSNGYMLLSDLVSEGAVIGTIAVGTQLFTVQFVASEPPAEAPNACYAVCQ